MIGWEETNGQRLGLAGCYRQDPLKRIVDCTLYIAYAVRGFVFTPARPPPESSRGFCGLSALLLPLLVPVGTFTAGASLRLCVSIAGKPNIATPIADPVPDCFLNPRHREACYLK